MAKEFGKWTAPWIVERRSAAENGFSEKVEQEIAEAAAVDEARLVKITDHFHDTLKVIETGALWESVADYFKPRLDSIFGVHTSTKTEEILKTRKFNAAIEPPLLLPIYSLGGQCIATPGNLSTATAHIKTGKTTVIGAMMAAPMKLRDNADCLGFTSQNPQGYALLHFDSEQSPDDHWHCVRRALRRAGREAPPPWFYSYRLTGLDCQTAWCCVLEAVQQASQLHGGIHSIFLDGYADFVLDVNNPAESNQFVANVHGLAIDYDCPIIGVIHFNPGSDKVRGHLGSQLERKAETNLRLDKVKGVTTIWSDKQRRAPIPKDSGPRFQWSDAAGMHVSVPTRKDTKDDVERGSLLARFKDIFSERPSMRHTELKTTVKKLLTVSLSTAERRIKSAVELGIIKVNDAGLYTIST